MRSGFAIIVILSTFSVLVHSMDDSGSSSGRRRQDPSEEFAGRRSRINTETGSRITGGNRQDVPSSSRGIRHKLPYLVTPQLDQMFKEKYGRQLNSLKKGKMSKEQFDEAMETAAKDVFNQMIRAHYNVYTDTKFLTDDKATSLTSYDRNMEVYQRRDEEENIRHKLIAEYNWLKKEHLNEPKEQIGLNSKIRKVHETGEHYMIIHYVKRKPVKYFLEAPHRRD